MLGRAGVARDLQIDAGLGIGNGGDDRLPRHAGGEIDGARRRHADGAARVDDEFLVLLLDVEQHDAIAVNVLALGSDGRRRLDEQRVALDALALDGARRHVHDVLALRDGRRVAVDRAMAHIVDHGFGSMRVWTRCGCSSSRLK